MYYLNMLLWPDPHSRFGIEEKTEIIRMLEKDTFPLRFDRFLNKIRTDDLTMEEITAEVETVREKRHCAKI